MRVLKTTTVAASTLFLVFTVATSAHAGTETGTNDAVQSQVNQDARSIEARWAQVSAKAQEFQTRRSGQFMAVSSGERRKTFLSMASEARGNR
jgi:hypothetical protein